MSIDRDAVMRLTKAQIVDLLEEADTQLDDSRQAEEKAERGVNWETLPGHTKAQMVDELKTHFAVQERVTRRRLRAMADSNLALLSGRAYEDELAGLHERIAELERQLETARERIRALEGTGGPRRVLQPLP